MRVTKLIIHLDKFRHNIKCVQERVGTHPLLCVPVKADAYGHGAVAIANTALSAGAACFAIARVEEGIQLRRAGITAPILFLSLASPQDLRRIAIYRLSPFVAEHQDISRLVYTASNIGVKISVHLKIDTGMGRIGCRPEDALNLARHIANSPALEYSGTATHLAVSDSQDPSDIQYTNHQLSIFADAVAAIRQAGIDPGIVHAANSGAVIQHPAAYQDMVRPGIVLYGYSPIPGFPVEPVMEMCSAIIFIKKVRAGESISYGRTWTAPEDTQIATIPVGYADGLPRLLSGKHRVLIKKKFYPLVGRICMDQCMVDLGPNTDIRRGEPVTIFGGDADSASVIADTLGTIPYEIICAIKKRVPRICIKNEGIRS
ncbi:MAG: alanine racemase [Spirochaetaceae bacterium]|jgi:alanine racemase|nr:alanine racemase [Spirochaetaceae bacterium]